ncbi:MAG: hypothetical protein ACK4PR_08925 [Gammaproteobacteria bacterium]
MFGSEDEYLDSEEERPKKKMRNVEASATFMSTSNFFTPQQSQLENVQQSCEQSPTSPMSSGNESASSSDKSSDADINSLKLNKIIVTYRVNNDNLNLTFQINTGQRHDTWIKDGQGDHVTSYIAIISALLAATDATTIMTAIQTIKELAKNLLGEVDLTELNAVVEPETHQRELRKKTKDVLHKYSDFETEEIEQIYNDLKYSKIGKRAAYLSEISPIFLANLQKNQLITSFSKGRLNKKHNEGNLAKQSSRALMVLNHLCSFCQTDDVNKLKKKIESFVSSLAPLKRDSLDSEDDHVMRYGLNQLLRERATEISNNYAGFKDADDFKKFLENDQLAIDHKLEVIKKFKNFLLNDCKKIAMHLGNLYDYPRQIIFDLTKTFPELELNKNRQITEQQKKIIFSQLKDYFPRAKVLTDYSNLEATVNRTELTYLKETVENNFIFISSAFSSLVSEELFFDIKKTFVNEVVLGAMGWSMYAEDVKEILMASIESKDNNQGNSNDINYKKAAKP